jgi:hypothetical protein
MSNPLFSSSEGVVEGQPHGRFTSRISIRKSVIIANSLGRIVRPHPHIVGFATYIFPWPDWTVSVGYGGIFRSFTEAQLRQVKENCQFVLECMLWDELELRGWT